MINKALICIFLASPPTYRKTTAACTCAALALKRLADIGSYAEHQCQRTENTSLIKCTRLQESYTSSQKHMNSVLTFVLFVFFAFSFLPVSNNDDEMFFSVE